MRDKSQPMMPQEGAHELGEDRDTHVTMAENAGIGLGETKLAALPMGPSQ